jgi:hypothetical protein
MAKFTHPSNRSSANRPDIYEVGYGKPPVATRFKPGQSGNAKGRPKGSTSARAALEKTLSAPITITEGGVARRVEQLEAMFKATMAKALRGDARAAALVVRLMEQFGLSEKNGEAPATVTFTWLPESAPSHWPPRKLRGDGQ